MIVQRLNFQKIWTHPPPHESARVRGIDWSHEKMIAVIIFVITYFHKIQFYKISQVGYSTGLVVLLDIENQQEINSFKLDADITYLGWTQNTRDISDGSDDDNLLVRSEHTFAPKISHNLFSFTEFS